MKRKFILVWGCVVAGLTLLACQPPAAVPEDNRKTTPVSLAGTNWKSVAQQLVTRNAPVRENDTVLIYGGAQDAEFLEDIAVQVRKLGAFPLVKLTSDRLTKRMLTDVPDKYDGQVSALDMKLAAIANMRIVVENGLTEDLLTGIDPRRREASDTATQTVENDFIKRGVRQVFVGNGFYPAPWRAQRLGIPQAEMAKLVFDGVHMDYSVVAANAEAVKKVLAEGKKLHITSPNGTDLKLNIIGRPIGISDGIISPEDAKKGGSSATVWLLAGEVYLVPAAGTAEGKVVQTRGFFEDNGKELQNLTITFEKGKITSMTGSGPGFFDLKARL